MKKFSNINDIKEAKNKYRDDKIVYNLLNVIIGELDRLPTRTEPTEDQIYTVVKRMYENAFLMKSFKKNASIAESFFSSFINKAFSYIRLTTVYI